MDQPAVAAAELVGSIDGELSMWSLFVRADVIVQFVLIALVLASFWCWAVIFEKAMRMRKLARQTDQFETLFWSGGDLDELYRGTDEAADHPMAVVFTSAMREWRRSADRGLVEGDRVQFGLTERTSQVMRITIDREMQRLERYMGFLATVGSTAPFVGLFGTVWGIMNSFQAIAATKNTSLAVVAPGIAEALFATALGLVAAIPATVAYNKFTNDLGHYAVRLEGFAGEFAAIISRQLDERRK